VISFILSSGVAGVVSSTYMHAAIVQKISTSTKLKLSWSRSQHGDGKNEE
jgi:hypothetical protein